MKDDLKRERRLLRPGWSFEDNGKGIKKLNRRIARRRLKCIDQRNFN